MNDVEVAFEATTSTEPASVDCVGDDIHFYGSGEYTNGNNGYMSSRVATASPSIEEGRARRRSESLDFESEPGAQVDHIWSDSEHNSPEENAMSSDADFAGARFLRSHVSMSIRESFLAGPEPSEIFNKDPSLQIRGIVKLLDLYCGELNAVVCKRQSAFDKWQESRKLLEDCKSELSAKKVDLEGFSSGCALTAHSGVNEFNEELARLRKILEQEKVEGLKKQIKERQEKLEYLEHSAAESDREHQRSISELREVLAPYQSPTLLDSILVSAIKFAQSLRTCREENGISRRTADTDVTG